MRKVIETVGASSGGAAAAGGAARASRIRGRDKDASGVETTRFDGGDGAGRDDRIMSGRPPASGAFPPQTFAGNFGKISLCGRSDPIRVKRIYPGRRSARPESIPHTSKSGTF